jgi:hypothetical protein
VILIRKQAQFIERALPTETLIRTVRETDTMVEVRCFPRPRIVAEEAVRLMIPGGEKRLQWHDPDASCAQTVQPGVPK